MIDSSDAESERPITAGPPPLVAVALEAVAARAHRLDGGDASGYQHSPSRVWSPLVFEAAATALSEHRTDLARSYLDAAAPEPSEYSPRCAVEQRVLRAWLETSERGRGAGAAMLRSALDLAARHDLVAVFAHAGPEVMRQIADLPGTPSPFAARVLERASTLRRPRATCPELAEQLTDRELEILAYLPTRMTNTELAARCYVSPNTIKTHMAHIYRKLAVPNRNSAVARAQDLGLL